MSSVKYYINTVTFKKPIGYTAPSMMFTKDLSLPFVPIQLFHALFTNGGLMHGLV